MLAENAYRKCSIALNIGGNDSTGEPHRVYRLSHGNPMKFDHSDPELNAPLTDEELDFLERFLSGNAVCDDAMGGVMLHGFLTAVISGPNMLMPGTILPWIWDARHATRQPRFLSAGRARKVTGRGLHEYRQAEIQMHVVLPEHDLVRIPSEHPENVHLVAACDPEIRSALQTKRPYEPIT